jgi:hypothetical protein
MLLRVRRHVMINGNGNSNGNTIIVGARRAVPGVGRCWVAGGRKGIMAIAIAVAIKTDPGCWILDAG